MSKQIDATVMLRPILTNYIINCHILEFININESGWSDKPQETITVNLCELESMQDMVNYIINQLLTKDTINHVVITEVDDATRIIELY